MTETSSSAPVDVGDVLRLLQCNGAAVVPHVAARLGAALSGDSAAIAQVASSLSPAQRAGLSALPDPLPAVRAVRDAVAASLVTLSDDVSRLLLTAAVSVDARVDVALTATGITMADALASDAAEHLTIAAGRFSFTDPRVRAFVHGSASLGDRTSVHAALARAYETAGDEGLAMWHTSLSTLEGNPDVVPALLGLAERALPLGCRPSYVRAAARYRCSRARPAPWGPLGCRSALARSRRGGEARSQVGLFRRPNAPPSCLARSVRNSSRSRLNRPQSPATTEMIQIARWYSTGAANPITARCG